MHLFLHLTFGLLCLSHQKQSLEREGSLRMLWLDHSSSILFQNTSYFKMFGHLEAVFHGAFHLIKQKRVPLKSTGRNINSPVKKNWWREEYFDECQSSFLRAFEIVKTNKLLIRAWESSLGSCPWIFVPVYLWTLSLLHEFFLSSSSLVHGKAVI